MDTLPDSETLITVDDLGPDVKCHVLQPGRPPLFIEPKGDVLIDRARFQQWATSVGKVFERLILEHGGIVLRGFPTPDTADFAHIADLFPPYEEGYIGGVAPRVQISGKVMEATRLAATIKLPLHTEMAYLRNYPKRIAFFCKQAALEGGETIIGDVRNLIEAMPPALIEKIERLGVRTIRNYGPKSDGLSQSVESMETNGWNIGFETDDPAEAEARCAERGLEPLWNDDGTLTVFNRTDPFVIHPGTGKKLYRTILHGFTSQKGWEGEDAEVHDAIHKNQKHRSGTYLGDGQPLSLEEIAQFEAEMEKITYQWPWHNGDIMVLDNLQVWHGRNPYKGPREVQAALLG